MLMCPRLLYYSTCLFFNTMFVPLCPKSQRDYGYNTVAKTSIKSGSFLTSPNNSYTREADKNFTDNSKTKQRYSIEATEDR